MKAAIIGYWRNGATIKEISELLWLHEEDISQIITTYKILNNIEWEPRSKKTVEVHY